MNLVWVTFYVSSNNWNEITDGAYPESTMEIQNVEWINYKHFKNTLVYGSAITNLELEIKHRISCTPKPKY